MGSATQIQVSVIIVNYNGGPLLTDCVRSVLSSREPIEILVADNCSEDGSDAMLENSLGHEDRVQIEKNEANLGFAKANNRLITKAKGKYLLFLNPDCTIKNDTLEKMIRLMEGDKKIGMAGCLIRNPNGTEQAGSRRYIPTPWRSFVSVFHLSAIFRKHPHFKNIAMADQPLPENPMDVEAISGAFMFVRRTALDQVGPMDDEYFIHCEDLDWCMRFRQAGWKIVFVPNVEVIHVKGVPTATCPIKVEYHKHRGMIRFYNKFFRQRYTGLIMWMVVSGVWLRFAYRSISLWLSAFYNTSPVWKWTGELAEPLSTIADHPEKISTTKSVIVTGATSQIGFFLLPLLARKGYKVHAVSREPEKTSSSTPCITWHQADINNVTNMANIQADTLIHLAPLKTLPPIVEPLAQQGIRRIIAFGSTSRFSKAKSTNIEEQQLVRDFVLAEESIADQCEKLGLNWTIFRPTLIYGCGMDKNITNISRFIQRFGFFPMVGDGSGLRQPVHAKDLAMASLTAIEQPLSNNKAYNLSGGTTLTYRVMVETIFQAMQKKPFFLKIPVSVLKIFLSCLSCLPGYRYITPEMADRINEDLCFDHAQATKDIDFKPQPFNIGNLSIIHFKNPSME